MFNYLEKLTRNFSLGEFFVTNVFGGQDQLIREFEALPRERKHKYYQNIVMLTQRMQEIRDHFGKPIKITSGWRSVRVNKIVGGKLASYHLTGMACDFTVEGVSEKLVQRYLIQKKWQGGLGFGHGFTHVDIRPTKTTVTFNY